MILLGMPKVEFVSQEPPAPRRWEHPQVAALLGAANTVDVPTEALAFNGANAEFGSPVNPVRGVVSVVGGPGTGKTSLLIDIAVAQLAQGRDAEDILIVAQSKEAATRMRAELAARVSQLNNSVAAGAGGMVRAVHSLAFAVVRQAAISRGDEPPSLTTGARQDSTVRQLLLGHSVDGGSYWPPRLKSALQFQGMARSVRDFLLRAAERGVDADRLEQLGAEFNIPEWSAAGKFMGEYRQTLRLAGQEDLNAAELVSAALQELDHDPDCIDTWSKSLSSLTMPSICHHKQHS